MTKENAHEYLPFVQALAEGKEIERLNLIGEWVSIKDICFDSPYQYYRIKPEKKIVPFTWEDREFLIGKCIKSKSNDIYKMITLVTEPGINNVFYENSHISYQHLFEYYTFLDGSPCGKEVEE